MLPTRGARAFRAAAEVHWRVSRRRRQTVLSARVTLTLSTLWRMGSGMERAGKGEARQLRDSLPGGRQAITKASNAESAFRNIACPLFSVIVEATSPESRYEPRTLRSPPHIFTARQTSARACTGKRPGRRRLSMAADGEDSYRKRFNAYAEVGPRLDPYSEEIKTIEGDTQLDAHGFATLACESPFKDNPAIGRASVVWRADVTSIDGQTLTLAVTWRRSSRPKRVSASAPNEQVRRARRSEGRDRRSRSEGSKSQRCSCSRRSVPCHNKDRQRADRAVRLSLPQHRPVYESCVTRIENAG